MKTAVARVGARIARVRLLRDLHRRPFVSDRGKGRQRCTPRREACSSRRWPLVTVTVSPPVVLACSRAVLAPARAYSRVLAGHTAVFRETREEIDRAGLVRSRSSSCCCCSNASYQCLREMGSSWVSVNVRTYHSHRSSQQRVLHQEYTVDETGATLNAVSRAGEQVEEEHVAQPAPTTSILIRDWKVLMIDIIAVMDILPTDALPVCTALWTTCCHPV